MSIKMLEKFIKNAALLSSPFIIWNVWYYISLPNPPICYVCKQDVNKFDYTRWGHNEGWGTYLFCIDCENYNKRKKELYKNEPNYYPYIIPGRGICYSDLSKQLAPEELEREKKILDRLIKHNMTTYDIQNSKKKIRNLQEIINCKVKILRSDI